MKKEYPWEVRSDAETLQRHQEIVDDPARLSKAKEFLQEQINTAQGVLKKSFRGGKFANPATLPVKFPEIK